MPWLSYGINQHSELISIADTPRGKTDLVCPYCGGGLIARRGEILEEHFAHAGVTCRAARRTEDLPTLPCYDNFLLHLAGRDLEALRRFYETESITSSDWNRLEKQGLVTFNSFGRTATRELTKQGKIPVGALSLMLFNEEQEKMIWARHFQLEHKVQQAWQEHPAQLEEALTDLRIYRAQWCRILSTTLYFLEIRTAKQLFHKIGVTTRNINARIAEIRDEVDLYFENAEVVALGTWDHRGNVELYFKHRYRAYQEPIGTLTEYYIFEYPKKVLTDLRRMKPKTLRVEEIAILTGKPAEIDRKIQEANAKRLRNLAIAKGMERARAMGKHIGRPGGSREDIEEFLAKASSQKVIEALQKGMSLRRASEYAGVAVNTVRKVREALTHR